jgi:hypothetical protein
VIGCVDASPGSPGPLVAHLVSEGIGEALRRLAAPDAGAVEVDEGVQLHQGELSVAFEDGDGDGAETGAVEDGRVLEDGRERSGVGGAGSPAVPARRCGPEQVVDALGFPCCLLSFTCECCEPVVERV